MSRFATVKVVCCRKPAAAPAKKARKPRAKKAPKVETVEVIEVSPEMLVPMLSPKDTVLELLRKGDISVEDAMSRLSFIEAAMANANHKPTLLRNDEGTPLPTTKDGLWSFSACAILRWMGQQGWSVDEAEATLEVLGVTVAHKTIECQVDGWRSRGAIPALAPEQVRVLNTNRCSKAAA